MYRHKKLERMENAFFRGSDERDESAPLARLDVSMDVKKLDCSYRHAERRLVTHGDVHEVEFVAFFRVAHNLARDDFRLSFWTFHNSLSSV